MSVNKILLVNIGFIPESLGGTEYYTYNLALGLQKQGHEVTVLAAVNDLSLKRYKVFKSTLDGIQVYKIANSHLYARKFEDFYIDETIDKLFKDLVAKIRPDLVHFQHLALLSANLPQITHELGIPSVLTLHDYWMMCHRSRLLRPGCGICSGPANGTNCASCDDGVTPNPVAVPKYPNVIQFLNKPSVKKTAMKAMALVPQEHISQVRSRLFGGKLLNPVGVDQETLSNSKLRYETFKKQLQFPQLLISPSKHLKHRFEQEGFDNISVVPLGFNLVQRFDPLIYNGKLRLTFIGSIEPHKGVTFMLDEIKKLPEIASKIELNIYGNPKDPIYASKVKKLAQSLPAGLVKLNGSYRSDQDLDKILADTHMVIFPSLWEENHPLVIREALLRGRPVIGSNLGGVSEVIKHGVNGLLFNPFQTGDLVNQLNLVIDNPSYLETLTLGAQNSKIENMDDHIVKLHSLYEQLLIDKIDQLNLPIVKEL